MIRCKRRGRFVVPTWPSHKRPVRAPLAAPAAYKCVSMAAAMVPTTDFRAIHTICGVPRPMAGPRKPASSQQDTVQIHRNSCRFDAQFTPPHGTLESRDPSEPMDSRFSPWPPQIQDPPLDLGFKIRRSHSSNTLLLHVLEIVATWVHSRVHNREGRERGRDTT